MVMRSDPTGPVDGGARYRYALAEAERHYARAIELLAGLPETDDSLQQELSLQPALVEPDLREAVALAHEMGAKLQELRAATSLARQLVGRGRTAEGRELLAPLYASFTEGFGARDLVDAKALLDELG